MRDSGTNVYKKFLADPMIFKICLSVASWIYIYFCKLGRDGTNYQKALIFLNFKIVCSARYRIFNSRESLRTYLLNDLFQ
jgi:hypothetical protein